MAFRVDADFSDPKRFRENLQKTLEQFEEYLIQDDQILQVFKTYKAPAKPREGMIVLADGTSWDPGAGQGFYGYYGSAWVKLG